MHCSLPHNPYCCLFPSPICACFTCSSVHASTLRPLLANHHLWYIVVYCVCAIKRLLYIYFFSVCIIFFPFYIVSVKLNVFVTMLLLHLFSYELCVCFFPNIWFDSFLYIFAQTLRKHVTEAKNNMFVHTKSWRSNALPMEHNGVHTIVTCMSCPTLTGTLT